MLCAPTGHFSFSTLCLIPVDVCHDKQKGCVALEWCRHEQGLQFSLLSVALMIQISSWQLEHALLVLQFSKEVRTDHKDQFSSHI